MRIWVSGAVNVDILDNKSAYHTKDFDFKTGSYKVKAQIFSKSNGGGEGCSDRTFQFSIKNCNANVCKPKITFKNTGCEKMNVTSSAGYRGTMDKGKTWSTNTAKGTKWTFKVGGKTEKTWTVGNCKNSTQNIDSKGCDACKPKITFKNTGCERMDVTSSEGYRGAMDRGKTWSTNTAKGTKWTFKVGGKTVKTWTVGNCKNSTQNIDSKGCGTCKSRVWFKNKGLSLIHI